MADVKWIKLSTSMFEDEKIRLIEALPESDTILIIWVKLLAQAGKTNASGYIFLNEHIPFTDEMLATIFNRSISTVRLALKTFQQFGMIEITDENFISITNWEKHQNIEGMEKVRKLNAERNKRYRERKKQPLLSENQCDVSVTSHDATEVEVEREVEKDITTTTTTENPIVLFERLLCRLSSIQSIKLYKWVDDFNGHAEIINEAIIIADNKNKRYFGFVEFLLKEWSDNNLDSLDRVRVYEQEKFNKFKKPNGSYNKKPIRKEQLPDWFEENTYQPKSKDNNDTDLEAKRKKIEDRLKKFHEGNNS